MRESDGTQPQPQDMYAEYKALFLELLHHRALVAREAAEIKEDTEASRLRVGMHTLFEEQLLNHMDDIWWTKMNVEDRDRANLECNDGLIRLVIEITEG